MLRILDHTPAAFLVVGHTKPHRAALKAAGGRFVKWSWAVGWMFPTERRKEIEDLVRQIELDGSGNP